MIYGYARVSTTNQAKNGNSLEDQRKTLYDAGAKIVFADSYTGTTIHRPHLEELIELLEPGDTVIVTKLDRLARSAKGGIEIIDMVLAKGAQLNVLNMGMFNDTPTGKLTRTIFLAFAEFERDMIIERTTAGKEIAKRKEGWHEGRPKMELPEFRENYEKVKKGEITVDDACGILGISRRTYYNRVFEITGKRKKRRKRKAARKNAAGKAQPTTF